MYESSGSQFFRTTTGIRSGPDAFDESRFIMAFLTILGVLEILCSFRLVLEGKTGKEIKQVRREGKTGRRFLKELVNYWISLQHVVQKFPLQCPYVQKL